MLTMVILFAKFGCMKESKILLMKQLNAYVNHGSSGVLKRMESKKVFIESSKPNLVESFAVKENELSKFLTNRKDMDKFSIAQRNNHAKSFHLLRLDRTEEIKSSDPDKQFNLNFAIFLAILFLLFGTVSLIRTLYGASLMSQGVFLPLVISTACGVTSITIIDYLFNSKTAKQKVFHVEAIEVSEKDFELISDLKSQSLEHDFNYLFELFCEAYWDTKVNHSEEATKTSKIIVDRINEKLSIAIESENEQKAMIKDSFDNKWRMIGKEL